MPAGTVLAVDGWWAGWSGHGTAGLSLGLLAGAVGQLTATAADTSMAALRAAGVLERIAARVGRETAGALSVVGLVHLMRTPTRWPGWRRGSPGHR
ncbi:hypothetical protein OG592_02630 [Streptomyces avidinii]|uniref:hypothetical protein n=1 Tax=Streptomyces avidinii TaxID=1895 RepID=UPI003869EB73|nr:hypothetical protein OG592_02630 [Streptomyces avidinii]